MIDQDLCPRWIGLAASAPVSLAIVALALRVRALTASGAVAAFFVGVACLGAGGFAVGAALLMFFLTGSALSRMPGPRAAETVATALESGARDAAQVLANGGAAALCAAVAGALAHAVPALASRWVAASVCALAVAAADTWATEIGARSRAVPRSIATLRVVQRGVSGGVTIAGFLASIAGGALIGLTAGAFEPQRQYAGWVLTCASVGFGGAALDSILGATVQGAWHCDACDAPTEAAAHRCGAAARLIGGSPRLDNDGVNALSTIAGAAFGFLAASLL